MCEFKFAPFSCLQRRQHQKVSLLHQITSDQIPTSAVVSQDQSEKEFSVFIAQALQRVVNVVCYVIINLVIVNLSTLCCMQQSFPKLQLEINVMVLENSGSGMFKLCLE